MNNATLLLSAPTTLTVLVAPRPSDERKRQHHAQGGHDEGWSAQERSAQQQHRRERGNQAGDIGQRGEDQQTVEQADGNADRRPHQIAHDMRRRRFDRAEQHARRADDGHRRGALRPAGNDPQHAAQQDADERAQRAAQGKPMIPVKYRTLRMSGKAGRYMPAPVGAGSA